MDVLLQPPEQTRSRRGRAEVVNELLWVAAKRTFTSPGPWPLILVNDQREHPGSSLPLMSVSQSRKLNLCNRHRGRNSLNCVVATTHLGDTCLIWQLTELCGGHHALGRYLPYMATR